MHRGVLQLAAQPRRRQLGESRRQRDRSTQPAATARAASSADHTSGSVVSTDAASGELVIVGRASPARAASRSSATSRWRASEGPRSTLRQRCADPLVADVGDRQQPAQAPVGDAVAERGRRRARRSRRSPPSRRGRRRERSALAKASIAPSRTSRVGRRLERRAAAASTVSRSPNEVATAIAVDGVVEVVALVRSGGTSASKRPPGKPAGSPASQRTLRVDRANVGARRVEQRCGDRDRLIGAAAQAQHVGVEADDELVDQRRARRRTTSPRSPDRGRLGSPSSEAVVASTIAPRGIAASARRRRSAATAARSSTAEQSGEVAAHVGDRHRRGSGRRPPRRCRRRTRTRRRRLSTIAVEAGVVVVDGRDAGRVRAGVGRAMLRRSRDRREPTRGGVHRQRPGGVVNEVPAGDAAGRRRRPSAGPPAGCAASRRAAGTIPGPADVAGDRSSSGKIRSTASSHRWWTRTRRRRRR